MIAAGAVLFAGACLLVIGAGSLGYPALLTATVLVGLGECLHTSVLMPLVADLGPAGLRGRYMAVMGFSWWIGLAVAPVLGPPLLAVAPSLTFLIAAGVAGVAGLAALRMERALPQEAIRTPAPVKASHG